MSSNAVSGNKADLLNELLQSDEVFVPDSSHENIKSGDLIRDALALSGIDDFANGLQEPESSTSGVPIEEDFRPALPQPIEIEVAQEPTTPTAGKDKENVSKPIPARTRPKSQPPPSLNPQQAVTILTPGTKVNSPAPVLTPIQVLNSPLLNPQTPRIFQLGADGNLTPADIQPNFQQFVLHPVTPIATPPSQPRILRLQSTPSGNLSTPQQLVPISLVSTNSTPVKLINTSVGRRLSVQPQDFIQGSTVLSPQTLLQPIVPQKSQSGFHPLIPVASSSLLSGTNGISHSGPKLTAREKLVKDRLKFLLNGHPH